MLRSFFWGTLISLARYTRIIEFFAGLQIVIGFCTLCSPFFLRFGEAKALSIDQSYSSIDVFLENYYFSPSILMTFWEMSEHFIISLKNGALRLSI